MKVLSPEALQRTLREGRRGGVYLIHGDEEYLKEEAVAALSAAHLEPATQDFNFHQLRAADTSVEAIEAAVSTPPLLAEWRVVLLRDIQGLATSSRARSIMERLLEREIPGLLLIMTAQIPSGRTQFYEMLKRRAMQVQCASLSDADLAGFLMSRSAARGVELEPGAARLLASELGTELGVLLQELNKLIEFVGDRRRICTDDVQSAAGRNPRLNRWEWFDLVADRKFSEARAQLSMLLDGAENGVGLIIGLGNTFLRLGIAAAGGQQALEAALPPHQKWLANRVVKQVRGWSGPALDQALDDLLRADRLLKSTSLSDRQILEELLFRLQDRALTRAA